MRMRAPPMVAPVKFLLHKRLFCDEVEELWHESLDLQ